MPYDLNELKKKKKDPNYQPVGMDGQDMMPKKDMMMSKEDMDKMAKERAMAKKNMMMNRRTLMHDERLTQKTRSNLYDKYFKEEK